MKKIFSILSMLTVLMCMTVAPVSALSGVYDDAGIFSAAEIDDLNARIAALEAQTDGWDFSIASIDDAEGKTAQEYADALWDSEHHEHGGCIVHLPVQPDRRQHCAAHPTQRCHRQKKKKVLLTFSPPSSFGRRFSFSFL